MIEIKLEGLLSFMQQSQIMTTPLQETYALKTPFQIGNDKRNTIIRPPTTNTPEDIFSLPPNKLRDLVRGIVWREEHFRGMSIRGIARREKYADVFVGRLIRESLEIA